MYAAVISDDAGEAEFRALARRCLAAGLSPRHVAFVSPEAPSLLPALPDSTRATPGKMVPRAYSELLHDVICHRAADRFALLYEVLWRITHGERDLVTRAADPLIACLNDYAHGVRRDIHKMHAFLRFRAHSVEGMPIYTAWFEPQHFILKRAATFFVDRFASMTWLIATPIGTALWRDGALNYGPPGPRTPATEDSVLDELWLTYYRTTFNPARMRVQAMTKEMPKRYWRNMPETALIPDLVAGAAARVAAMGERDADHPPLFAVKIAERRRGAGDIPPTPIAQLRAEASTCTRCPLHAPATQTVFGEGPDDARLVFVGEQPGDQEDITGRPFVGPAGEMFDRALEEAGIARDTVYVTNAVKHFKYVPRGKRRIHSKPSGYEIRHCRELAAIAPQLVVALGGTAAQSLAGRAVSVLRERGPMSFGASFGSRAGFVTVHPSFLLRLPDERSKAAEYSRFVADLRSVRDMLAPQATSDACEPAAGLA
jgi:probable DNA metabolism protein